MRININKKIKLRAIFIISFFTVISCSTKKEITQEIEEKNDNSGRKTTVLTPNTEEDVNDKSISDAPSGAVQSEETTSDPLRVNVSNSVEDDDSLSLAARKGEYRRIISLTEGRVDDRSKYYRGIARMAMMLQTDRYSSAQRVRFRDEAINLLREVGYQSSDISLQARGLLWYGVTLDLAFTDLKNKKRAIAAFFRIERSKLKDTPYYNDALFYAAQTYSRMGWYGVARNYFVRAGGANGSDGQIYDYVNNRFYPIDSALEIGLSRLKSYVDGYNSAYSVVQ